MKITDLSIGDTVLYVPGYVNGNLEHPDVERGVVSAVYESLVFVLYEGARHPKGTYAADLVKP